MAVNQIKAGVVLSYCIVALNSIVGILYTPYMLRMLGQSEYGIYSLATSIIAYLGIMDLGFGNAIIRYVAKFRAEGDTEKQANLLGMFSCIYIVIGVLTLPIGVIFGINTEVFFHTTLSTYELEQTRIIIYLLAFNLSITFLFNVYSSAITAYEDFVFQKIVQIIRIILNTVVMIVLLYYGYKAIGLVVCQTIFNIFTQVLNWYYFKYKLNIKVKFGHFNWNLFKEILSYSVWIFVAAIIDRLYWSTGPFILGAEVGSIAVAVFSVAMSLEHIFLSFSTSISSALFPRVTKMVAKEVSSKEISDLFIITGRIQFFVVGFILSGFVVFGSQFIILWAGNEYLDSYYCALLLFFGLLTPLIQNVGISILQARNKLKFRTLCYLILSIGCVVGQYFFSKSYGAIGCSLVISMTLFMGQGVAMNIYYWRYQELNIPQFWIEIIKMAFIPFLTAIVAIVILQLCPTLDSWSKLSVAIIIYSVFYLSLNIRFSLNDFERGLIFKPFGRFIKNDRYTG